MNPARLRPAPGEMRTRIAAFIRDQLGEVCRAVRVRDLRRMAGGASRELWSLDVEIERAGARGAECLEMVLRCDPPGRVGEGDRSLEFRLLRAAAEAGVPVPQVQRILKVGRVKNVVRSVA